MRSKVRYDNAYGTLVRLLSELPYCLVRLLIRGGNILPIKELDQIAKFPEDWGACYLTLVSPCFSLVTLVAPVAL